MNFIFSLSFTKNDGESKKLLFWLKSDFKVNPNIGLTENKKLPVGGGGGVWTGYFHQSWKNGKNGVEVKNLKKWLKLSE